MKQLYLSLIGCCLVATTGMNTSFAQSMPSKQRKHSSPQQAKTIHVEAISLHQLPFPLKGTKKTTQALQYQTLGIPKTSGHRNFRITDLHNPQSGSVWKKGVWLRPENARHYSASEQESLFLEEALSRIRKQDEVVWKRLASTTKDGITHSRYQQTWHGVPVWDNALTMHHNDVEMTLTGKVKSLPNNLKYQEPIAASAAISQIDQHLSSKGIDLWSQERRHDHDHIMETDMQTLVLYPIDGTYRLVWHVRRHPNPVERWEYFVDAVSGEVIEHYSSLCKLHHPPLLFNEQSIGQGLDLSGQLRTIQTWFYNGAHYLIDASKTSMFNTNQSVMPGNPIGAILTLDALNTFPGNDDFKVQELISFATTWENPVAVSAHHNASIAFDYFERKFNRISINGQGGNIISLVNVVDEQGEQMDNAFWNGKAMFFGNGNQAFDHPLARSVDVTVHELTHGVIQTTANLNYQGESGALNESFADVFAVQVDREDWLIGEDVVNRNIFRTGALRSLSDPNNGGSSLADPGFQPDHYDERYQGREDNGGVHINSGIPNHAYYLFAREVGLDIAENVYFTVLSQYLTRSSQFVDLRVAVIDASRMLYGQTTANAAIAAFNAVGILGEQGGDYLEDEEENPGLDLIFISDENRSKITLIDALGNVLADPLTEDGLLNPPSVTDDGTLMVYVAGDQTIRFGQFDWNQNPPTFRSGVLESNPIWNNVAISRDGRKLAAIPIAATDSIYVFSLEQETFRIFELYNPTTSSIEISTGDVLYADAVEWDHSGEYLIYDAFNRIDNGGAIDDIEYWDIGFIQVWDENADTYADGFITKLFSGLPENLSVGNPTFSENSPYVMAFDLLEVRDAQTRYEIYGVNIETGDLNLIYENTQLGYPSYSRQDDRLIFDAEAEDFFSTLPVIASIPLAADKISSSGNASIFRESSTWGVWFGNGVRDLATPVVDQQLISGDILVYPNPLMQDRLYLQLDPSITGNSHHVEILSLDGKVLLSNPPLTRNNNLLEVDLSDVPPGMLLIHLYGDQGHRSFKIVKTE